MRFTQSGLCFCAVLIAVLHAAPSISAAGETHDAAFWKAAVAIQEKLALGVGGYFSPPSPETPGRSSRKKLFVCVRPDRDFPIFSMAPST